MNDERLDDISAEGLSLEQFQRFGIALCHRVGCDRKDKRLAKALRRFERSLGPPADEKLRRDALNAASSVHRELRASDEVLGAVACTLVCACLDFPNENLIGNFEWALQKGEHLSATEARAISREILRAVLDG